MVEKAEKSGKSKEYTKQAFALDEQVFRRLLDVINTAAKKLSDRTYVRFSVSRSDDSFYYTRDIEEVLAEDNSTGRTVDRVSIELNRDRQVPRREGEDDSDDLAYVSFWRREDRIVYFVTYPDRNWSLVLADEIDAQVRRTFRQRIRWLPPWADGALAVLLVLLAIVVPAAYSNSLHASLDLIAPATFHKLATPDKLDALYDLSRGWFTQNSTPALAVFTAILLVAAYAITTQPLNAIRRAFRQSYFLWGDQIPQAARRNQTETNVIWTLGAGIVASLIASVILSMLGKLPHLG